MSNDDKWDLLNNELKTFALIRAWYAKELEYYRDAEIKIGPLNNSLLHYMTISNILFAYGIEDLPEHLQDLSQESLEIMLHNFGVDPREFI